MLESKKVLQSLYTWIVVFSRLPTNFFELLEFCSSFLYFRGYLVYFMCTRVEPFYAFKY